MNVIEHYDHLISKNNDPFRDPLPMQMHMDKWDGPRFIDSMRLSGIQTVLEIGVGTGRLAAKVAPHCRSFLGIDLSAKTIERAGENLVNMKQIELICADFLTYDFVKKFDVVYSSLTMMHIENKQAFMDKVATLLEEKGRFCLSIDKNQSEYIDMEDYRVKVYPDRPEEIIECIRRAGLELSEQFETKFAHIFVCEKMNKMIFKAITATDNLWTKTKSYALACPWRAGKSLAKLMDKNAFTDWERVIVALDGEKICGFCTVVKKDCIPDLEYFPCIGYVFVDEAYRGQRLSQKMINYVMEYAMEVGFDSVYLVSDHENFYEKYGFEVIDNVMAPWGTEQKIYMHKVNI